VIGTLLQVAWLPVNQAAGTQILYFTGEFTAGFSGTWWEGVVDRLQHIVLPTIAIALGQIAYFGRYQRSAMLDVLGSDFSARPRAKGLARRRVLFRHGLRTALIPMATLFAFGFGLLITGGVFTERIFGCFGMGDWLITRRLQPGRRHHRHRHPVRRRAGAVLRLALRPCRRRRRPVHAAPAAAHRGRPGHSGRQALIVRSAIRARWASPSPYWPARRLARL